MPSLGGAFKVAPQEKFGVKCWEQLLQTGNYSISISVPRSDHGVVP